jgi:hypothetical protein
MHGRAGGQGAAGAIVGGMVGERSFQYMEPAWRGYTPVFPSMNVRYIKEG